MRRYLLATLPALLLAACNNDQPAASTDGSTANSTAMAPAEPTPVPTQDTDYLAKAGAGDLFEIESSRAILARTGDADVKKFAQMMIDAHTESTAKLKAAAADAGLVVAPALDADQQTKLDDIKSASAEAATRSYLAAQRTAHAAALTLHQDYARSGGTPSLKTAAGEIAPVVQQHIDMLAKLPGG